MRKGDIEHIMQLYDNDINFRREFEASRQFAGTDVLRPWPALSVGETTIHFIEYEQKVAFVFKEIYAAHFRCDLHLCQGAPAHTIVYRGVQRDGVFM